MATLDLTVRDLEVAGSQDDLQVVPERHDLLPSPPDDEERDSYLGRQHRWVVVVSFFGSLLTVISVLYFVATRSWAAFILVPVTISAVGALASLVTSVRRRRDSLESHRAIVSGWRPPNLPSVDVFLPSAGEELHVLRNTFEHVRRLSWDGALAIYVLDDSAREEVRELAQDYGFTYLTRPDRGHLKKAGNLRFGYAQSRGDLIAIFDADFVPRPDFLHELVPYFDAQDVALVQSPQFFDMDKRMNWVQYSAGATQILFYRWIQPAWDRSGAAICVGTCALYRRAALDRCGGFAAISHSEDVYTGVNCMQGGYRVRYVPTVVSKGLCPDNLDQFLTQQYRWCTGSMSLLFSRRFHRIRMTAMQRLSYWAGFLYYISTALEPFIIALPPILMGFFAPEEVRLTNYIFILLALVVRQAVIPVITVGRDSHIAMTRIQTTYSFAHTVALFDVLRGRTDAWVATGAVQKSPTSQRVRRLVRAWLVTTQLFLWFVILWRSPEHGWLDFAPMGVFALLSLVVVYPIALGGSRLPKLLDPMFVRRSLPGIAS